MHDVSGRRRVVSGQGRRLAIVSATSVVAASVSAILLYQIGSHPAADADQSALAPVELVRSAERAASRDFARKTRSAPTPSSRLQWARPSYPTAPQPSPIRPSPSPTRPPHSPTRPPPSPTGPPPPPAPVAGLDQVAMS